MTSNSFAFPLIWRLLSWPARVAEARREFAFLAELDDRGLADLGLTRQDLRDATAFSLADRPSSRLAERAREREALAQGRRRRRHAAGSAATG